MISYFHWEILKLVHVFTLATFNSKCRSTDIVYTSKRKAAQHHPITSCSQCGGELLDLFKVPTFIVRTITTITVYYLQCGDSWAVRCTFHKCN